MSSLPLVPQGTPVQVTLANLPAPTIIQQVNYQVIFSQILSTFQTLNPAFTAVVEGDPAYMLLQVLAYQVMLIAQQEQNDILGLLLAYAIDSQLDQIAANVDVIRLPGEQDNAFRLRIQQAMHLYSVAGPAGAYRSLTYAVAQNIADVAVFSPSPGSVTVAVMAYDSTPSANATAQQLAQAVCFPNFTPVSGVTPTQIPQTDPTITAIQVALNSETVRPVTDVVSVVAATPIYYPLTANLTIYEGFDSATVLSQASANLQTYLGSIQRIGRSIPLSGLIAALQQTSGVLEVVLAAPTADVTVGQTQFGVATPITLNVTLTSALTPPGQGLF